MIERVTSVLELLGVAFLTAAVGVATYHRFGTTWTLVALALTCFLWSVVLELLVGRLKPRAET